MIAIADHLPTVSIKELQARFVGQLLPRIKTHASIVFRDRGADEKAELTADAVALGWRWFTELFERGKDPGRFAAVFTSLLVRAVSCGRRVIGMEKAKDALSKRAQRRHDFQVEHLPLSTRACHEALYGTVRGQRLHDEFEERLRDNSITPVLDQVQFRVDWPAYLATLTRRERRIIRAMVQNERTKDLARRFELSPGRISQMRRDFQDGWNRFCGDAAQQASA